MTYLNAISLVGIFGLCAIAWLFSENRSLKYFPWRVVLAGILLQLGLGALVFVVPGSRDALQIFSDLLNGVFDAADFGARFVFGSNIVPAPGVEPNVNLGYIFAFRALPTVVFFSGLVALLYNLGLIQAITNVFAKIFYSTMRLSGAESLSGAANIFVGIEAAIVVKPFLAKMTRSELCAILACCFGTSASSTLAIYVSFLRPVFPNILAHLVSASIIGIPACFVLSKILVPETGVPLTAGGIPVEKPLLLEKQELRERETVAIADPDAPQPVPQETVGGEPIERVSPLDAAIVGALDGVKMAVSIAAVLILILGLVSLINQTFGALASLQTSTLVPLQYIGQLFSVITLQNIAGVLFLPLTVLTGVSLDWNELWLSSVIIGRRLLETAIPPYQALGAAGAAGLLSDRAILIVSYALSGFAHVASVGIFVGGTIALIPSRRKDISELGWKALFVGTLATVMISCVAGVFDTGDPSILGREAAPEITAPAPSPAVSPLPEASPSPDASPRPAAAPSPEASPTVSPDAPAASPTPTQVSPPASPTPTPQPATPAPATNS